MRNGVESEKILMHHIGIWVRDMEAAGRFYKDVLGFQKVREYEVPKELMEAIFGTEEPCKVQVFGGENVAVELFEGSKEKSSGINHIAISVGDKKAFCEQAKSKGGQVIEVLRDDHYVYFVKDSSGTLIEVKD